ncbi:winged helix-turn-helix transcriptional regulator [Streptomyces hokutonensis]|uniref:winged helix-turn-helix transcriptional regulator n=1 Tax=Streptomyces hokutonensis TaxID=1306990 RepID=UPI003807770F
MPGPERRFSRQPGTATERYLQSVIDLRHLLSGEWVWDVFVTLHKGPAHYSNLLTAIQDRRFDDGWPGRTHVHLRDGTLNRTLRRLEQGELVERMRDAEFPYHTTYELTPAARELMDLVLPAVEWVETHADLVDRARRRRHQEASGDS